MSVPKLLTLNAPTVRNQRTLIWLQKQDNINWSKWDAVVTSISDYHRWSHCKIVGLIMNEINEVDTLDELFTISKQVPIILISQNVLSLQSEQYWSQYDNLINLDDLDQYPFLTKWDGTNNNAVAILGLLCRYNRIVDCIVDCIVDSDYPIIFSQNIKPKQTWVITQFFKHADKKRFLEIKECLKRNCACPDIDRIILINEKDYSKEFHNSKIHQVVNGKRLTYSDFLQYVYYSVPKNVNVILCNSDIYFDDLSDLHKINMENRMLGLLRWDVDTNGNSTIFGPRADSQDSWIFLSDSIKSHKWDFTKFNFQLGQAGCDNAFAGHILRNKFVIANPAITLKTYHLHNTNIRNYDKKDYIRSDVYINIAPTYIIDTRQETEPPGWSLVLNNETASFEVKSSSMSNEITYCTMLEKEGRYKWEPCVENYYFDALHTYTWKNVGVTPNGLVYTLYSIYTGEHDNYWENANVDILTPLQKCDKMFAIPFKNTDIFKNPDTYILNYVSRCARLLQTFPGTSFWLPRHFLEYMEYFNLDFNFVYFDDNTACWAKEVIGFLPGPNELGMEDIDALRSLYPWIDKPVEKTCAIVIHSVITEEFAEKISTLLKDWSVRFVFDEPASYDSLLGAELCIFTGNWSKLWALPKDCRVIEFQQELQINGEFQHLAHVAGFKSWILLLSKGSIVDVQEQMMEQLGKWFSKNG